MSKQKSKEGDDKTQKAILAALLRIESRLENVELAITKEEREAKAKERLAQTANM